MGRKRSRVALAKPGTPAASAESFVPRTIHVFHYTAQSVEETDVEFAEDLAAYRGKPGITWVNVDGLGNPDIIREIGKVFELHPLAVEDVMSLRQRPKVDRYPKHLYFVVKHLHYEEELSIEQMSILLGTDFVLTFQERPGDCFEPIRERLREGTGPLRREGADFLLYSLVDSIVDNYFPFLERVGEVVDDLEAEVIAKPTRRTVGRVHDIKRDLLDVRRATWPLRDAVSSLLRDESPLIGKTTRFYLRDCYDHTVLALDVVETFRDVTAGLMEVYLSSINVKMQEVMKVLTIIATIFMPLSFIASVYGMNFKYFPEIYWYWGYPVIWGVMLTVTVVMLLFFRHKGWLGGDKP